MAAATPLPTITEEKRSKNTLASLSRLFLLVFLAFSFPGKSTALSSLLLIPSGARLRRSSPCTIRRRTTCWGLDHCELLGLGLWRRHYSTTTSLDSSPGQELQPQTTTSRLAESESDDARKRFGASTPTGPVGSAQGGGQVGGGMLLLSLRHRLATTSDDKPSKEKNGGTIINGGDGSSDNRRKIRLVLASQSPRRREILSMMGLEGRFDVVPSPLDEEVVQRELQQQQEEDGNPVVAVAPPQYAERLALAKATALAEAMRSTAASQSRGEATEEEETIVVVLGSDTIVELDGRILEKPRDETEAKDMLSSLSGRQHLVHTGVAMACLAPSPSAASSSDRKTKWLVSSRSFVDTAAVQFVTLTPDDIDAYVSTGEPMDKAGSYGIQGIGGQMVESVSGDFFTVMGLPMCRVSQALARLIEELR